MYELVKLNENDYCIDSPAKVGIVRTSDADVVLIDGGSDRDAAKKILHVLDENGWKLTTVFNTHSHADHIGGNQYLQNKTGCRIYARGIETAYSRYPILEPAGLYGGFPFRDLRSKFLLAEKSDTGIVTEDVLPYGLEVVELSGHSADMVGFVTRNGTAFVGDSVLSQQTLSKHGLCYFWDVKSALASLERLKKLKAKYFVPSHADVTDNIVPLAEINERAIVTVTERILSFCRTPVSFDVLLKYMFDSFGLRMTAQQFVLAGSTVRSYLSYLYENGNMSFEFADNIMLWKATV